MIPQNFNDSRLINSTSLAEMSDQAKIFYYMAAQELQKHVTNSIIANRNLDFYLKRSFELDPTIAYYNFYKETDVTKLKVFLENFLKYIPDRQTKSRDESESDVKKGFEETKILKKISLLEYELKNTLYSLRVTKSSELELINELVKSMKSSSQVLKLKNEIEFLLSENESYLAKFEQVLTELQGVNKSAYQSPQTNKGRESLEELNEYAPRNERSGGYIGSRRMTRACADVSIQTGDIYNSEIEEIYRIAPTCDSKTLRKILSIAKGIEKDPSIETIRKKYILENEEARITFQREKEYLEQMLKDKIEELISLKKQTGSEKEDYERELVERNAELSLQRQIYLSDKEGLEKVIKLKTEDIEKLRKQHLAEKEKLFEQLAQIKREAEEKTLILEESTRHFNSEKEDLNKKIQDLSEENNSQRTFLQNQIREKEIEFEKNKQMIMGLFKEKCDEWEKNTENLTKKMKEKYDDIELSKENLRKEIISKESDIEKQKSYYEQLLLEKVDEVQEHKEILLQEIQESNSYK